MSIYGYIRVSTDKQNNENQRLAILDYCNKNNLRVDNWIEVTMSSRKSIKDRKIKELLEKIQKDDTVIVAELSRLARSVGQVAVTVDKFIRSQVKLISIKESIQLNGRADIQTKVMITMFSLFAEIERDLVSERTKEGLIRARAEGKLLGRPKGSIGKSKLDGKEKEIKDYLRKGVNKQNIGKIYGVSWPTINNFIMSRELK
ncbi:MAG: recombinase family protein [bacterium]